MKKWERLLCAFLCLFMVGTLFGNTALAEGVGKGKSDYMRTEGRLASDADASPSDATPADAVLLNNADDAEVWIKVNPETETVTALSLVTLTAGFSGSQNVLPQGSSLVIKIPKVVMAEEPIIGYPDGLFQGVNKWEESECLVLEFHGYVPEAGANSGGIKVTWKAPWWATEENTPDPATYYAELYNDEATLLATDEIEVKNQPKVGSKPLFDKWSMRADNENGIAIMTPEDPDISNYTMTSPHTNVFILPINYIGIEMNNVVITDVLPEGVRLTELRTGYTSGANTGSPIIGGGYVRVKQLDIADDGFQSNIRNVSDAFANKVTVGFGTGEGGRDYIEIEIDHIASNQHYFIEYAVYAEDKSLMYETITNEASLACDGKSDPYVAVKDFMFEDVKGDYLRFKKTAEDGEGNSKVIHDLGKDSTINYVLTVENNQGVDITDAVIIDVLPEHLQYERTADDSSNKFEVSIDGNGNVKCELMAGEVIADKEEVKICFEAKVANEEFDAGASIFNKAILQVEGKNPLETYNEIKTVLFGKIKIIKTDDTNEKNPLSGAEFKIYNEDESIVRTVITGDDGTATTDDLPAGTYYIKETKAPSGYIPSRVVHEVTISQDTRDEDGIVSISLENSKSPLGSITLKKIDEKDSDLLNGAEFILYRNDKLKRVYEYYTVSNSGEVVWSADRSSAYKFISGFSGNVGEIIVKDLEYDYIYMFEEIKAPADYEIVGDGIYEVPLIKAKADAVEYVKNKKITEPTTEVPTTEVPKPTKPGGGGGGGSEKPDPTTEAPKPTTPTEESSTSPTDPELPILPEIPPGIIVEIPDDLSPGVHEIIVYDNDGVPLGRYMVTIGDNGVPLGQPKAGDDSVSNTILLVVLAIAMAGVAVLWRKRQEDSREI